VERDRRRLGARHEAAGDAKAVRKGGQLHHGRPDLGPLSRPDNRRRSASA
jgi:hypothetical protein